MDGVFINILDPYVVMDLEFNVINMNIAAKDFLGYDHSKESLNLSELVHRDFIEYTFSSFQSLLEVGTLNNYKAKIITKDLSEKWVQINSSLIYNSDGKPIATQGIIRDMTIEMEIKELLGEQKKQLDIIVENSPLGIVLTDNGKIIKTNTTFSTMVGYSKEELAQKRVQDISSVEDVEKSMKLIGDMNADIIDNFSIVKNYTRKDTSHVLAKTIVSAVRDENNKIGYQVALIEDISKQREAEERLKNEREKYSSIIANMNLGLVEVDNEGIIQTINPSLCKMSGFTQEELVAKKADDVLRVVNRDLVSEKSKSRLKGVSDSYEIEVLHKNGSSKHWLISGAPRYDADKKVIGSIGIHLDITNQKQLEFQKENLLTELERSNQGLQEYAHIVSHDLKSPLRTISALASWLVEDYNDKLDDNGKFNLQQIQEKIEGMDSLIDGILRYSNINNDTLDNTIVDLNQVIHEIREIIFIPESVNVIIMNVFPSIKVDKTKIHQLFQNLISNAVVNIERKEGVVEISSKETPSHWQFTIKDNGIGIPKEYHEKIFKIFQSIGNNERSTGIGLSIVKKIIDLYEGKIWLESEVGQGTTFYFTLKK